MCCAWVVEPSRTRASGAQPKNSRNVQLRSISQSKSCPQGPPGQTGQKRSARRPPGQNSSPRASPRPKPAPGPKMDPSGVAPANSQWRKSRQAKGPAPRGAGAFACVPRVGTTSTTAKTGPPGPNRSTCPRPEGRATTRPGQNRPSGQDRSTPPKPVKAISDSHLAIRYRWPAACSRPDADFKTCYNPPFPCATWTLPSSART